MGTVWAGTDELLRRPVAVKEIRLPPGIPEAEAAELRERALREARAIAVVTHPNVVTLYDVARQDGAPFVVMELVPAESLATILDEHGPLDDVQLAVVVDGVAAGLEAAHRAGIVHRDVKPGNVLIGEDDRSKLTDFGIARNITDRTITRTGIMLGTPAYIAPEIAGGHGVDTPSDLWGLGATLYAAADGAPPYDHGSGSPLETVAEVVRGPVPRCKRGGPLGAVIAGLMVKNPQDRMPLTEVRRRVQHLLPTPGDRPFGMLLEPDAPTVRVRPVRPEHTVGPELTGSEAETGSEWSMAEPHPEIHRPPREPRGSPAGSTPLASEPGPPPFPLTPPRSRVPWRVIGVAVASVLLFVTALAGGFAGTRLVAGVPLLPTTPEANPPPGNVPPSISPLTPYSDNAQHTNATSGGRFSLSVPADWTVFHYEQQDLGASKTVSFVSEDGKMELAVQRFGNFFGAGYSISDYVDELPELAGGAASQFEIRKDHAEPGRNDRRLQYATTETTETTETGDVAGHGVRWSTSAELSRHDTDLWIVRVTAPERHTSTGQELFAAVLPDFRTAR